MAYKYSFDYCPECDSRIRLRNPRLGQQILCRECDTTLEVVELSPLELDWAFEEGYDEEPELRKPRYADTDAYADYDVPFAFDD